MTAKPANLAPGSGLYLAALLEAARRVEAAGVGSKSQAAYDAHADLGAVLLAYNGAPYAWAGRMTPDRPAYPHNPRNRVNPQIDDYVIDQIARVQALDAAAAKRHTIDPDDFAGAITLESEIEAVQGQISAVEYGGNTGTRESAPDCLARLGAELAALKARRHSPAASE